MMRRSGWQTLPSDGQSLAMTSRWALAAVVSEEFLNGMSRQGIGDGVVVEPFRQVFSLPMMGDIDLSVGMTITSVEFEMSALDPDRLRATVSAAGVVEFLGDNAMPAFPGAARVRGEVMVSPTVELRADGSFVALLDLASSELVAMHFDGIDGMDGNADAQAMMGQMLFQTVGGELFTGLAEQLGTVGLELTPDEAEIFAMLGVAEGPADIVVNDGSLVVGLCALETLDGHAALLPVDGRRLGVGIASGALADLAVHLANRAVGVPLPFAVEIDTSDRRVGGRLRSRRLIDLPFLPDLRTGVRYTVRPRLLGDQIELSLREAWLELPLVPPIVNDLNRFMGGVASRAPLSVKLPASVTVPVRPDSDTTMTMSVAELHITDGGVTVVVDMVEHDPAHPDPMGRDEE